MDASIFWPAFKDAGLLDVANIESGAHAGYAIDVGFTQPGVAVFGGQVQAVSWGIEYQTGDAPDLALGDRLNIGTHRFKVAEHPEAKDSHFSIAALEKIG